MPIKINMLSSATNVKGQGVGSMYMEQVGLIKEMAESFTVYENRVFQAPITHYHTVDFKFFLSRPFLTSRGASVGYVHMLPESVDGSLKLPWPVKKAFYRYMISFYKGMDFLVTVNPFFVDVLSDKYHIPRERITYIPNFVSGKGFHRVSPAKRAEFRQKYNIAPDAFVVMSAGQIQVRKGVFDFLKLAEMLPDITFVWAGGFSFGAITDGYKEMKSIIENPPQNVIFTGIIDREYMNEIFNIADVMLLASYSELFPVTILEGMCVNLPILLRDLPIYKGILANYYLKAADVEGFADEIRRLKNDGEYYAAASAMSQKGNEFYSKDNVERMWRDFYMRVYNAIPERKRRALTSPKKLPAEK
ncbi:MAG: glycosyltransferase family 4 protein [Oscillospiraceae bacterium]|nr:glycosyltransferase family 4 protein [Oscillospiraceae bacterium]